MSDKITVSAKVEKPLAERVDDYAGEHEMKRSAAIRDLLHSGLDVEQNPHTISTPILLLWLGSLFAATQYASASGLIGPLGILLLASGLLTTRDDVKDRIEAARARYTSYSKDE